MKKSYGYQYEFGKKAKEQNRHQNYYFVTEILERELEMEDEGYTDYLYKKRYVEEFLTMFWALIGISI
jgi:translation initiation factor IF-3